MATKNKTITLNHHARTSALIYAETILEACRVAKIKDPIAALIDTDDYPRLKRIDMVEYAIGWLNGCAESHGVTVVTLWEQIVPSAERGLKRRDAELRY
jgi:hypothetical protein